MNEHLSLVRVGVTVIVTNNKQILLAKRKGSHGEGTWDTPGGHLERGESVIECAIRETLEETNLRLNKANMIELGFTEDIFTLENKHYISCVVRCEINSLSDLKQNEPHKFATEWMWYDLTQLPDPLFIPVKNALTKFVVNEH